MPSDNEFVACVDRKKSYGTPLLVIGGNVARPQYLQYSQSAMHYGVRVGSCVPVLFRRSATAGATAAAHIYTLESPRTFISPIISIGTHR